MRQDVIGHLTGIRPEWVGPEVLQDYRPEDKGCGERSIRPRWVGPEVLDATRDMETTAEESAQKAL